MKRVTLHLYVAELEPGSAPLDRRRYDWMLDDSDACHVEVAAVEDVSPLTDAQLRALLSEMSFGPLGGRSRRLPGCSVTRLSRAVWAVSPDAGPPMRARGVRQAAAAVRACQPDG